MKKLHDIKKSLFKELGIIGIILAISGGVAYGIISYENKLFLELTKYKNKKRQIENKVIDMQREYDNDVEAFNIYQEIPEHRLPTKTGYDTAALRIRVARPIIERLKERYKFTSINITFSAIKPDEKNYNVKNIAVITNNMMIKFSGMSDELIFSFIHSIIEEFPGYIELKSLKINKSNSMQEVITSLSWDNTLINAIDGDIIFIWRALKGELPNIEVNTSGKNMNIGT